MLWWVPWCFLRGSGTRGKGQGPASLPQWGGGAGGAGGESTLREGRNALVGPLVLPAWKWNEGGRGRVRSPSLSGEAAPAGQVARAF